jgi:hypothetical protein
MTSHKLQILDNASASSDGSHVIPLDGMYEWAIEGTFNGGSYQLQATGPNGTFFDIPGATLSAAGAMTIWFTRGTKVKAVETGATSAMYSTIIGPLR